MWLVELECGEHSQLVSVCGWFHHLDFIRSLINYSRNICTKSSNSMRLPSLTNLSSRTVDQERIEVLQVGLSFLETWAEAMRSVLRQRNGITKMELEKVTLATLAMLEETGRTLYSYETLHLHCSKTEPARTARMCATSGFHNWYYKPVPRKTMGKHKCHSGCHEMRTMMCSTWHTKFPLAPQLAQIVSLTRHLYVSFYIIFFLIKTLYSCCCSCCFISWMLVIAEWGGCRNW